MSKRHFIALADMVRELRPDAKQHAPDCYASCYSSWEQYRDALAEFCKSQNSRFNRQRWMDYINGECGPNGGRVKKAA